MKNLYNSDNEKRIISKILMLNSEIILNGILKNQKRRREINLPVKVKSINHIKRVIISRNLIMTDMNIIIYKEIMKIWFIEWRRK